MDNTPCKKISKRSFIAKICKKKGLKKYGEADIKKANDIYNTFMDVLTEEILAGNEVSLTGFGNFALKLHKGHQVQFSEKDATIDDYLSLKFVASGIINKKLRNPELLTKVKKDELVQTKNKE